MTVADFCDALPRIRRLGFSAYQPEIYVANALPEWLREAGRLQRIAVDLGLVPTQFVAHFMLEWFASPERLGSEQGLDELKCVVEITQAFPACRVITVPAGQFQMEWGSVARTRGERVGRHPTARDGEDPAVPRGGVGGGTPTGL